MNETGWKDERGVRDRGEGGESVCTGGPSLAGRLSFGLLSGCRTSERIRLDASICRVTLLTLEFKQNKMDRKSIKESVYPGTV